MTMRVARCLIAKWDIEISRWGDPAKKNAQYVLQPYYVASNVHRFNAPAGNTHVLAPLGAGPRHFSHSTRVKQRFGVSSSRAGVPSPGIESIRVVLYIYRAAVVKLQHPMEVVIERFTYFP